MRLDKQKSFDIELWNNILDNILVNNAENYLLELE